MLPWSLTGIINPFLVFGVVPISPSHLSIHKPANEKEEGMGTGFVGQITRSSGSRWTYILLPSFVHLLLRHSFSAI